MVLRPIVRSVLRAPLSPLLSRQGGGPVYDPDAEALFARFTTPPTDERKGVINTLIVALKAAGTWAVRDWYHFIGADAQATQRNWKADQYNIMPVNAPAFQADRYYQGDGSSSYLNIGAVRNALANLKQDSANLTAWVPADAPGANTAIIGTSANNRGFVYPKDTSGRVRGRINGAGSVIVAGITTAAGGTAVDRGDAANVVARRNGIDIATQADASATMLADTIWYMRDGSLGIYSTHLWAGGAGGGHLTAQQQLDEHNAVAAYLTTIGAMP